MKSKRFDNPLMLNRKCSEAELVRGVWFRESKGIKKKESVMTHFEFTTAVLHHVSKGTS